MIRALLVLCALCVASVSVAAEKVSPLDQIKVVQAEREAAIQNAKENREMAPAVKLVTADGHWECVNGQWVFCPRRPAPQQPPQTEPAPKFDIAPAPAADSGTPAWFVATLIGSIAGACVVGGVAGVASEWKKELKG